MNPLKQIKGLEATIATLTAEKAALETENVRLTAIITKLRKEKAEGKPEPAPPSPTPTPTATSPVAAAPARKRR